MASADFSRFVVTTAFTVHETSRDKSRTFPRLPAQSTHEGYGCLWDFTAFSQLIRLIRLVIGFLFVGPRFRYGFFSPTPHDVKLASRYRVRRQLRPLGLPPKLRDMPVILQRGCCRSNSPQIIRNGNIWLESKPERTKEGEKRRYRTAGL